MKTLKTEITLNTKDFISELNKIEGLSKSAIKDIQKSFKAAEVEVTPIVDTSEAKKGIESLKDMALKAGAVLGTAFAVKGIFDFTQNIAKARNQVKIFSGESGEALDTLTAKVQSTAKVFGKDFNETLVAANSLAKGFGISIEEATGIINQGFLAGGDLSGELLDQMREYPGLMKQAGLNANEFTAIIAQSTKEGIFSDKGIDTVKEAMLRIREMTPATKDAINALGLSSDEIQSRLRAGTTTVFEEIQGISRKMQELPPVSTEVGTALADIFGGPGEDAAQFIDQLGTMETDLNKLVDAQDPYVKQQQDMLQLQENLNKALTEVGSALFPFVSELLKALVPIISDLIQALAPLIKELVDGLAPILKDLIETLLPVVSELIKMLAPIVIQLLNAVMPLVKVLLNLIAQILPPLMPLLEIGIKLLADMIVVLTPLIELLGVWLTKAIIKVVEEIKPFIEGLAKLSAGFMELVGLSDKPVAPLKKTGEESKEIGETFIDTKGKLGEFNKELLNLPNSTNSVVNAMNTQKEAVKKLNIELTKTALAQSKLNITAERYAEVTAETNKFAYEPLEDTRTEIEKIRDTTIATLTDTSGELNEQQQAFADTFQQIAQDGKITMSELSQVAMQSIVKTMSAVIDAYIPQIIAAAAAISPFLVPAALALIGTIKGLASSVVGAKDGEVDIKGSGTSRSDSILRRVSVGETILNARAAQANLEETAWMNKTGKNISEYYKRPQKHTVRMNPARIKGKDLIFIQNKSLKEVLAGG